MSSHQQANDSVDVNSEHQGPLSTIRNSALLLLAVFGLIEIVLGYLIHTGVWAAILAVWGGGLVILGVVGYAFIWWQRQ